MGDILGLQRDNGKENGNCHLGLLITTRLFCFDAEEITLPAHQELLGLTCKRHKGLYTQV